MRILRITSIVLCSLSTLFNTLGAKPTTEKSSPVASNAGTCAATDSCSLADADLNTEAASTCNGKPPTTATAENDSGTATSLTEEQRQMLLDNATRRKQKLERIESKLEALQQQYQKANMFAIVQEQLDEIKAQLDTF